MSQQFQAPQPLERVKAGDSLSARSWNAIIDNLQQLNQPKQVDDPLGIRAGDPPISEEEAADTEPAPTPEAVTATTWTEQSRVTSTFEVDGVTYEQIDQMVMQDTSGNTMTWIFNNPN